MRIYNNVPSGEDHPLGFDWVNVLEWLLECSVGNPCTMKTIEAGGGATISGNYHAWRVDVPQHLRFSGG